ncbi:MAG: YebC/PmpR family DNA-binding transcriptional regulator [Bdellovibrionales bacterium]|nr:YebC/PmpR family DNA-binding transcriptional regulator [Bdellovibrionales bacterium]
MGKGWKNVHKAANAAAKGKIFTKLAREISVASKLGGPDPEGNSRLKIAIEAARKESCPKDTIERAIKKGAGLLDDGSIIEELMYEGQGPFGVGVIVECQTDNKNRTVSELRNIFKRHGGSLGETNSAAWMFDRVSLVSGVNANVKDAEEEAIEAGANEVEKNDDGSYSFYGAPSDLDTIRTTLSSRGWTVEEAQLSFLPKNKADINAEQMTQVQELLQELDEFDDSHRVHATL